MKTIGVITFNEVPSECPTVDPGVLWSSEEPVDEESSSPCGASLSLGVEDFWAQTTLLLMIF